MILLSKILVFHLEIRSQFYQEYFYLQYTQITDTITPKLPTYPH